MKAVTAKVRGNRYDEPKEGLLMSPDPNDEVNLTRHAVAHALVWEPFTDDMTVPEFRMLVDRVLGRLDSIGWEVVHRA